MALVTYRVKKSTPLKRGTAWLMCEKHGSYTPEKGDPDAIVKTKKSGCLFNVKLSEFVRGSWKVECIYRVHNHSLGKSMHDHNVSGQLTSEEYDLVKKLTKEHVKPMKILTALHRDPNNVMMLRQLYNKQQRLRMLGMEGISIPQQFFAKATKKGYFV